MILYTQYYPVSVFFCHLVTGSIPFQVVPPASMQDAAFCENSYYYFCVLLGNAIARTVSSYEFLVFCVNSLLSLSRSRWFHLVLGSSNSFQVVPGSSYLFQLVPCFSMYATRHFLLFL